MVTKEMEDEARLGYWHFVYELEKYFSQTVVGRRRDTMGWGFPEYAQTFVEYDIEGYGIYIEEKKWSPAFRDGVITAYQEFMDEIRAYREKTVTTTGWLSVEW